MNAYAYLSKEELAKVKEKLSAQLDTLKAKGLRLDMSRGKPSVKQLDLSNGLVSVLEGDSLKTEAGFDCRNYGLPDGIPEMKRIFADMLCVTPEQVILGNNSSLSMMYDTIVRAMLLGMPGGDAPWSAQRVKFLCPSPGYDRHFAICEQLGIEMVTIEMKNDGPDMDEVERLVSSDSAVKGIWCVPMYSNPEGVVYSDAVVRRFAALKPAAKDFRIFWDNAYCVHHLNENPPRLLCLLEECRKQGKEDMALMFASTSKVSFAGAGIAAMAASPNNIESIRRQMSIRTIGPDKVNQLAHVRFFKDMSGITEHMKKHAELLRPKFAAVFEWLEREIAPLSIGEWMRPQGGYFISFNSIDGCAKRVVELCKYAGVVLTPAGATFPYGRDPRDRNIRIAPTVPPTQELVAAMEIFCVAVKLASAEKMLER